MDDETCEISDEGFLTVAASATVVRDLHWVCATVFGLFVRWATEVDSDRGDVAVWFSTTGRHLGSQAEDLKALMPESILLGELTALGAPSAASREAIEAIRAISGAVVRLAIAQRVLLAQLVSACELVQRVAQPHADAPLLRRVSFMLLDLRNDLEAGRLLLERLMEALRGSSLKFDEEISAGVMEAERQLDSANGLVPAEVLRLHAR